MSEEMRKNIFPKQTEVIKNMLAEGINVLNVGEAGMGKALDVNTLIPTVDGFKKISELKIGDKVFDENGKVCNVIEKSPVFYDHDCYKITFDNGEAQVIADADHKWCVQEVKHREKNVKGVIKTTSEIAKDYMLVNNRAKYSIPVTNSLQLEDIELPLSPYILGLWLGDGSSYHNVFTTNDPELLESFKKEGYGVSEAKNYGNKKAFHYGITDGLYVTLKELGVLDGKKHIPNAFLRASYKQRIDLIQGLMDTDGYCDKQGNCSFTNKRKEVVNGLAELLRSIGIKANVKSIYKKATNSVDTTKKEYWVTTFTTNIPMFRLERKLVRQNSEPRITTKRFYIRKVEKIETLPTQCISVDSESHLFLCTENFIPTHNSETAKRACIEAGREYTSINLSNQHDVVDLTGSYTLEEVHGQNGTVTNKTLWRDGKVVEAARTGKVLILEELTMANPSVLAAFHGLFEAQPKITTNNGDVEIKEGFQVIATANPSWTNYQGVTDLNYALEDRFVHIMFGFPERESFDVFIEPYLENFKKNDIEAKQLYGMCENLFKSYPDTTNYYMSLRGIDFYSRLLKYYDEREALEYAFINKIEPDRRNLVLDIIDKYIPQKS